MIKRTRRSMRAARRERATRSWQVTKEIRWSASRALRPRPTARAVLPTPQEGTEQEQVGAILEELQGRQATDETDVDRRLSVEVEVFEPLAVGQAGKLEVGLDAALLVGGQFDGEQAVQDLDRREHPQKRSHKYSINVLRAIVMLYTSFMCSDFAYTFITCAHHFPLHATARRLTTRLDNRHPNQGLSLPNTETR